MSEETGLAGSISNWHKAAKRPVTPSWVSLGGTRGGPQRLPRKARPGFLLSLALPASHCRFARTKPASLAGRHFREVWSRQPGRAGPTERGSACRGVARRPRLCQVPCWAWEGDCATAGTPKQNLKAQSRAGSILYCLDSHK